LDKRKLLLVDVAIVISSGYSISAQIPLKNR